MKCLRVYLLIALLTSMSACDALNYDETTNYQQKKVFNDYGKTKQFLNHIYSFLPYPYGGFNNVGESVRASATDNAEEINPLSRVQGFNDGSWSAINLLDDQWGHYYNGIAAVNRFLENFNIKNFDDRKYNAGYDDLIEQARLFPYQARFLRAYFYFNLIKRYEHVPLIKKILSVKEANNVQSSSYQKVTNFIVAECDTTIRHLPIDYHSIPSQETGRITRGAAMALKARALLYAASPLHNFTGDNEKWKKAAVAAKAIIDSSWYSLESDYDNAFNNRTSKELILGRRQSNSNRFERDNFPVGFEGTNKYGTAPTQNLVDAYEMQKTGNSINAPNSEYDPDHPYQGRDPRLKKTIIVNNSTYKGRKIEIWNGGKDGPPQVGATTTGYYLKKQVIGSVSLKPNHVTTAVHAIDLFRYGEVLLNYAEAMNEVYGPDDPADMGLTARQAVDKIRKRVNMPGFPAGMSKSQFRDKLHNERRVELAFENQRFWDIRRWKIGPSTHKDIKGMKITKQSDGSFIYNKQTIEHRVWNNRKYLYPIPQNEVFKNKQLKQNPGW